MQEKKVTFTFLMSRCKANASFWVGILPCCHDQYTCLAKLSVLYKYGIFIWLQLIGTGRRFYLSVTAQPLKLQGVSQHQSSRIFVPDKTNMTCDLWAHDFFRNCKCLVQFFILYSYASQTQPSCLLRFDTIIARSAVIQNCNNIIVTTNHYYTYFNFNKLL